MRNIFFLQIMCNFNSELHYENVYANKEKAIKEGVIELEKLFRKEYEEMFETNDKHDELQINREQLFKLQAIYDFSITEYDPEYIDSLEELANLPVIENCDIYNSFCAELKPAKIKYGYNYNGNVEYISGIYFFNYNGKKKEHEILMRYKDYINSKAGTKFKKGDIVKIKKNSRVNYSFSDKLHVITDVPHKRENQKFFENKYSVIVNHNSYDEGCHVDIFNEDELEIFIGNLPYDSPILFLSKFLSGEMKLENVNWNDIECGHITLNENKSFRDIPEIMKQLKNNKRRMIIKED